MLKKIIVLLILLISIQMIFSCGTLETAKTNISIENKLWNENDSKVIADSIVNKLLLSEWNTKFTNKGKPKLVIGSIEDLTDEKINTDLLSKNIERSFINSGNVTFVSSKFDREIVRSNRKNKNDFKSKQELKEYLKPLKLDFFISGNIKLTIDSVSVPKTKEYKLTLEVIEFKNLESSSIISELIIK